MQKLMFLFMLLPLALSANSLNAQFKGHTDLAFSFVQVSHENPLQIPEKEWYDISNGQLNLGLSASPTWIKFTLSNHIDRTQTLFLYNAFVHIDKLTLYQVNHKQLQTQKQLGDSIPIKTRHLKDADHIFKLVLSPQSVQTYYMKAETTGVMKLNLSLWRQDKYIERKSKLNLIMGLFLGVMLASALILSVLFFMTKKTSFALAAVFNISVWLLFAWSLGYVYRYFSDQAFWFIHTTMPVLIVFALLPLNILSERILGLNSLAKSMVTSIRLMLGISVALVFLLPFINYKWALSIALTFAACHILVLLCVTTMRARKRDTKARLLVVCLFPLLITLVSNCALIFSHSIHFSQLNTLFGSCYLVSCVALTLIAITQYIQQRDIKVSHQQKRLAESEANEALQSETIRLQEEHQKQLESKIQERTFELEVTLRELQEKNLELEDLNTQDALTGLRNRRHFDKKIKMEFRRSRREQTPLAIVMLDIDHFKTINDQYGHLAGDEAIKFVAGCISSTLRRPSDIACRYGGEEFALILPNTDSQGAKQVSETIRQKIQTTAVHSSYGTFNLTISAGICCHIADADFEPNQYTDWADKALYTAKQQGRNRICIADFPPLHATKELS